MDNPRGKSEKSEKTEQPEKTKPTLDDLRPRALDDEEGSETDAVRGGVRKAGEGQQDF